MPEEIALKQRRRTGRNCRHHWLIETPHGATSRGFCKHCGRTKRFPNAAEDALWETSGALGRWSSRGGIARPAQVSLQNSGGDNY